MKKFLFVFLIIVLIIFAIIGLDHPEGEEHQTAIDTDNRLHAR